MSMVSDGYAHYRPELPLWPVCALDPVLLAFGPALC